ncbi:MAG: hypothetical protein ACXQS1_03205 [Methermicoccaceae archaeon]
MGGTNLTYFIVKQLPAIPPDAYPDTQIDGVPLTDLIKQKALELHYTSHQLEPLAREMGYEGPPFEWDEDRRAHLKAELDAIYAHLYGVSHDDLDYILDTFPIVKKKDEQRYGTYRTKQLVLKYYDEYDGKIEPVDVRGAHHGKIEPVGNSKIEPVNREEKDG